MKCAYSEMLHIAPQDRQKDGALHLFRVEARGILEVTADYR